MSRQTRWQIVILCVLFIGYAVYCLNRKIFTYLITFVIEDTKLDKQDLGIITSSISVAYALSKFISSLISDSINARLQFSVGLIIVGLSIFQFSLSNTVTMFTVMYFVNGLGQGSGWPPCVKLLKQWFPPSQLGFLWSLLSASANVTGTIAPLVLPYLALQYGWRSTMWFTGVTAITMACIAIVLIKNSPADAGLTPSETSDKPASSKDEKIDKDSNEKDGKIQKNVDGKVKPVSEGAIDSKRDVITSPFVWILSFLYMMVKMEMNSCEHWGQLYLVQEKHFPVTIGSTFLSVYSIGAACGSIGAGYVTDMMVAKHGILKRGSARYSLVIAMVVVDLIAMHCFRSYVSSESSLAFIHLLGVLLGACQYSCFALYGVMMIEHSPSHLTGMSHGIGALCANIGGVLAGYPMSYISQEYNTWSSVLLCVEVASLLSLVTLVLTRNVRSTIGKRRKLHKE